MTKTPRCPMCGGEYDGRTKRFAHREGFICRGNDRRPPVHPSHDFCTFDGINYNCSQCDCKLHHRAAERECGT